MTSASPFVATKFRAFTPAGAVPSGYYLHSFVAGSSVPQATYTDASASTTNVNPYPLDAYGQAQIWLKPGLSYKLQLRAGANISDALIEEVDGVTVEDTTALVAVFPALLASSASTANGDALVAVKQPWTGAVATTQHIQNQQIVSVWDFLSAAQKADARTGFAPTIDCTAAFQAAADYAKIVTQSLITNKVELVTSAVFVPHGRYKISSQITLGEGTRLFGESKSSSILEYDGTGTCIYMGSGREQSGIVVEELALVGTSHTGTIGIYFDFTIRGCQIKNCHVSFFAQNLVGVETYQLYIENCYLHDALNNNIHWTGATAATIEKCRLDGTSQAANIVIMGGANEVVNLSIRDCAIQGSWTSGLYAEDITTIDVRDSFFESNDQQRLGNADILVLPGTYARKAYNITVDNAFFTPGSVTDVTTHRAVDVRNAHRVSVSNCSIWSSSYAYGIVVSATVDVLVARNNWFPGPNLGEISSNSPTRVDYNDVNGYNFRGLQASQIAANEYVESIAHGVTTHISNLSNSSGSVALQLQAGTSDTNTHMLYGLNSASSACVRIEANGDLVNVNGVYGTISDVRLKENISSARSYLSDLTRLRPVVFSFKAEHASAATQLGLIADEVEQVFPRLVTLGPDGYKSIKTSVLVPMLITAIQELSRRVDSLENN